MYAFVDKGKIDQVVDELDRYKVDVAAIWETMQLGKG